MEIKERTFAENPQETHLWDGHSLPTKEHLLLHSIHEHQPSFPGAKHHASLILEHYISNVQISASAEFKGYQNS